MMEDDDDGGKQHFSLQAILQRERAGEKRRRKKKRREEGVGCPCHRLGTALCRLQPPTAIPPSLLPPLPPLLPPSPPSLPSLPQTPTVDDFQVDVQDPRFAALYDSHLFAPDPADPQYKYGIHDVQLQLCLDQVIHYSPDGS